MRGLRPKSPSSTTHAICRCPFAMTMVVAQSFTSCSSSLHKCLTRHRRACTVAGNPARGGVASTKKR